MDNGSRWLPGGWKISSKCLEAVVEALLNLVEQINMCIGIRIACKDKDITKIYDWIKDVERVDRERRY